MEFQIYGITAHTEECEDGFQLEEFYEDPKYAAYPDSFEEQISDTMADPYDLLDIRDLSGMGTLFMSEDEESIIDAWK